MNKISRKLITLCLVCIMAVGICGTAYANEMSPFADDTKYGPIPSSHSTYWTQPDGYKAYRLSVWNQGNSTMKVTVTDPNGESEAYDVKSSENKIVVTNNGALPGKYVIDFSSSSGVVSGEYGVRWSTVSL